MKTKRGYPLFMLSLLAFSIYLSLYLYRPPEVRQATAPKSEFSAVRAMRHLNRIAHEPRPMGSGEHRRVMLYIEAELNRLGYETEIQESSFVTPYGSNLTGGMIRNVIGRLPGTQGTGAVLVVGHYDSVANSPGAADNGAAVAAMLEAARAMRHNPAMKNDLILLFSDAEEVGLVGAKAYVEEHALAEKKSLVLNLEARGNRGVSVTFETSPQNGWLISEYAQAVSRPFAASLFYEAYRRLPNNTDFTVFKQAGYPGFNVALIDGFVHYHAMTDTPERLDPRSLQHHGQYIMDLVRHFGFRDISRSKAPDLIYFNPAGHWLLVFSNAKLLLGLLLLLSLLISALYRGLALRRLTYPGLFFSMLFYLLTAAVCLLLVKGLLLLIRSFYPLYSHHLSMNPANVSYYFWALGGLVLLVFVSLYGPIVKKLGRENLHAGALLLLSLAAAALYLFMPGAAYLLIYPLFLPVAVMSAAFFGNWSPGKWPRLHRGLQLLSMLPAVFLLVPLLTMIFIIFSLAMPEPGVILLLMAIMLLLPALNWLSELRNRLPLLAALAVFVFALVDGHLTSKPTPERPLHSNLVFWQDLDRNQAFWASANLLPDEANRDYFPEPRLEPISEIIPGASRLMLKNPAKPLEVNPVELREMKQSKLPDGRRLLSFRLVSPRRADLFMLMTPDRVILDELSVDGKKPELPNNMTWLNYHAPPGQGIKLELVLKPGEEAELIVLELSWGWPAVSGAEDFPEWAIPDTGFFSRATVLKKSFSL